MPDLRDIPLDRFCNFIWWISTRHAEKKDVEKLRAQLWRPPVTETRIDPRSPWSPEKEAEAANALKMQLGLGGKVPSPK